MTSKPLLILDFDGVIVDGLLEYWDSAYKAYWKLVGKEKSSDFIHRDIPNDFCTLRPWVKNGWEMVLLAAEILRKDSFLNLSGSEEFSKNYELHCSIELQKWDWTAPQLQCALDTVRREAINHNAKLWLASYKAFPFVVERLKQFESENIDFGVLTTKNAEFTSHLLKDLNLYPKLLHGHESGSKAKVLSEISKTESITGFIEDRLATLKTITNTPGLDSIRCYLAQWGYLKPCDQKNLPPTIHLLDKKLFMSPLANWH